MALLLGLLRLRLPPLVQRWAALIQPASWRCCPGWLLRLLLLPLRLSLHPNRLLSCSLGWPPLQLLPPPT